MKVAFVLRSGGEYLPIHVQVLASQVRQHLPAADVICLSDIDVPGVEVVPMKYRYPGWWSKMELMHPRIEGDLLYFDLDTRIVGDITSLAATRQMAMLWHDFNGLKKEFGSGVMVLPEEARHRIWAQWSAEGYRAVMQRSNGGDQRVIAGYCKGKIAKIQDLHPGQVRSFKLECQNGVPADTRVIYFHGKPRPWDTGAWNDY